MSAYISLKNVTKTIKGNTVLNHISLALEKGGVYGFVGKNGSGKTMLFRALAGLLKTDGEIIIDGKNIYEEKGTASIGIILENTGLFENLSAAENLKLLDSFSETHISQEKMFSLLEKLGLDAKSKKPFGKFSLGMKQKLCIAQAVMASPDIIILDEPTNALDESGVVIFRQMIAEEKSRGATVLIASHSKEDIEILCDRVFYLKDGGILQP